MWTCLWLTGWRKGGRLDGVLAERAEPPSLKGMGLETATLRLGGCHRGPSRITGGKGGEAQCERSRKRILRKHI